MKTKQQKRKEAELRQAEYNKLTIQEKFSKLLLNGSYKQARKLVAQLDDMHK